MAWGSKTSATQLTNITSTEQFFDQMPTLDPGETAHVQVGFDPVAGPTDDLQVNVYGTLDASAEEWDVVPMMSFVMDKDNDPNRISFSITGAYKFRVGVQATGGTDSHTSADMHYRKDGISL